MTSLFGSGPALSDTRWPLAWIWASCQHVHLHTKSINQSINRVLTRRFLLVIMSSLGLALVQFRCSHALSPAVDPALLAALYAGADCRRRWR